MFAVTAVFDDVCITLYAVYAVVVLYVAVSAGSVSIQQAVAIMRRYSVLSSIDMFLLFASSEKKIKKSIENARAATKKYDE